MLAVSSVSAEDLNNTDEIMAEDVSIDEDNVLEVNETIDNVLEVSNMTDEFLEINEENDTSLEVNDEGNILAVDYQKFRDIQDEIDAANPGDTVYINGTYYGFGYPIIINKPIKLVGLGDGAVLKANTNTNIKQCAIYINQSDVVIDNIKINNGCDQWGGAIYIECVEYVYYEGEWHRQCRTLYERIVISNCQFKDNSADGSFGYGGAIHFWTDDGKVINCTFINNHCTDFGGAIYTNGLNNKIINCTFQYNYISNELSEEGLEICRGGGAIYNDCQSLIIDGCTFTGNHAREAYGGALRLSASCSVKNSIFKDNIALLAKAAYCGNEVIVFNGNVFSLEYKEDPDTLFYGVTADALKSTNTFNKTRIDSNVNFHAGMIFEYGASGTIYVTVDGGEIVKDKIKVNGHPEAKIEFKNNVITVSNLPVGTFKLTVTTVPDDDHFSVNRDLKVTVKKATAVIKASKITVALKKGSLWSIKLINSKTGQPISNMKLTLKVFTGKKYKKVTVTTNSKGEATYQTKKLSKGNHKVVVSASDSRYNFNTLTSSIKVVKQTPLSFKVKPNIGKDGSSLSITVTHKNKGKNGVKINLLVYEGKKLVKTVTLKTKTKGKYKGVCGWGTNMLSVGTHKIVIKPAEIIYGGSKTVNMKIMASAKKYPNWETKI